MSKFAKGLFFLFISLSYLFSVRPSIEHCKKMCVHPTPFWRDNNSVNKLRKDITLSNWPTKCSLGTSGIPEFNTIFENQSTWLEVMNFKYDNFCNTVASEFITTFLNSCNTGCAVSEISQILISMLPVLNRICTISGFIKEPSIDDELLKNYIEFMRNSERTMSLFNRGELGIDRCIDKFSIDKNHNQVADFCELSHDKKIFCQSLLQRGEGNGLRSVFLRQCRLNHDIDDAFVCFTILSSEDQMEKKDCNGNGLIDYFEVNNTGGIRCSSVFCETGMKNGFFPPICVNCSSIDSNRNLIPDECEEESGRMSSMPSLSPSSGVYPFRDCNGDMLDDFFSIKFDLVEDKDKNEIPDECQWGACCVDGVCTNTNYLNCKGREFSEGVLCSELKTCVPFDPNEELGSCCVRMGVKNSFLKCVEGLSRASCTQRGGSFSIFPCTGRNCENTVGSCCNDYGSLTCINQVSWKYCNAFNFSTIFDTRLCQEEECLCNVNSETLGSCLYSKICEDDITFQKCTNLYGSFDVNRCINRIDVEFVDHKKKGSCCTQSKGCIDDIFPDHCESLNGKFMEGTCMENNYCHMNVPNDEMKECCYNPRKKICQTKPPGIQRRCFDLFDTDFVWTMCQDKIECRMKVKEEEEEEGNKTSPNEKCCKIKTDCLKKIDTDECLFFGGFVSPPDDCPKNQCHDFFSQKAQKTKKSRKEKKEVTPSLMEKSKKTLGVVTHTHRHSRIPSPVVTEATLHKHTRVVSSSSKVKIGDNEPAQIVISTIFIVIIGMFFIPSLLILIYKLIKNRRI